VAEVAAVVGYENPLYFSRIFRKAVGVPPSRYRRPGQPGGVATAEPVRLLAVPPAWMPPPIDKRSPVD
jgi:AraC-like DNA-binding protein